MKNFNRKIYALNNEWLSKLSAEELNNIPIEYYKMANKIANSFSKEYAAIGIMNINALNHAFIDDAKKKELIDRIVKEY